MLGMDPTMSPSEMKSAMQLKSIADVIIDPQAGSPNLLLYVGEGSGGGYIPEPYVPVGKNAIQGTVHCITEIQFYDCQSRSRGYSYASSFQNLKDNLRCIHNKRLLFNSKETQTFFLALTEPK